MVPCAGGEQPGRAGSSVGWWLPWHEPSGLGAGAGAEPELYQTLPKPTPPSIHGEFCDFCFLHGDLVMDPFQKLEYPHQGANSSSVCCPCLSLLCPLDGSLPSALTCLCVFLPSFAQEFQAGLSSPWLFPTAHLKEHCLRLSPNLCPSGLVAAALLVQGGSCGPFSAVLVLALPRTRLCSHPSQQEFPLSPWQPMKSPGHRMCLCTFCWGRRGEGAELCSASSTLVFPAFLVPPPRS